MPLNAVGWTSEEDEALVELVQPHAILYNLLDPSRKNILARASTWQEIAQALLKPVEECKKRWRGLRDGYMRSKRVGTVHKTKASIFEKLQFLDTVAVDGVDVNDESLEDDETDDKFKDNVMCTEQQVITDNQEYYEITLVDGPKEETENKQFIKIMPKNENFSQILLEENLEPPKKIGRKNAGRKKSIPVPRNTTPIKILPKPILLNEPRIVKYVEEPKTPEQRSQVIDKLIEKILKENTNEIDVFFRSMAASVKKLQPNLIPKVKMEVCNVIAKYEMQSFDKQSQNN
ncbi:uncharacterized protein LOC119832598 [Zerene cesonia]|uniref:uncharacterized protein LOC119832598 n=1 Tax=Zerene cesonia TaxID=33412 RepID=UPI0018E4F8A2|nr:uncharacterized protein LOC119832598 [Zerene cesonia]